MKTILVTVTKEGAQATCKLVYRWTCEPVSQTWAGNHKAFTLRSGRPMNLNCSMDYLERDVKFQADQCAATFKIEDLGGEAEMWMDNVILE